MQLSGHVSADAWLAARGASPGHDVEARWWQGQCVPSCTRTCACSYLGRSDKSCWQYGLPQGDRRALGASSTLKSYDVDNKWGCDALQKMYSQIEVRGLGLPPLEPRRACAVRRTDCLQTQGPRHVLGLRHALRLCRAPPTSAVQATYPCSEAMARAAARAILVDAPPVPALGYGDRLCAPTSNRSCLRPLHGCQREPLSVLTNRQLLSALPLCRADQPPAAVCAAPLPCCPRCPFAVLTNRQLLSALPLCRADQPPAAVCAAPLP
eukprot:355359-Chlamydomonas_euryale.AAC.23